MAQLRSPCGFVLTLLLVSVSCSETAGGYISAVGDPGMRRDGLRLGIEAWNQCNEVGEEAPNMGSPRAADCFDVYKAIPNSNGGKSCSLCNQVPHVLVHRVTEEDNKLGVGQPIPGRQPKSFTNVDLYASEKELYLGSKCQVKDTPNPWQFWMIMLKSGNMDTYAAKCPKNGHRVEPYGPDPKFPCFGKGCMNQPLIYHKYTTLQGPNMTTLGGRFFGSWDLDYDLSNGMGENSSYHSVKWEKEIGKGSWIPESPNFKVKFTLNVIKGGGPASQFYLLDIGSCWKNNGNPCDGNVTSDVTRYSEFILNPETPSWCRPGEPRLCPPYHTFANGTRVHRTKTDKFPYEAYHLYCSPGNGEHLEKPYGLCDPFSNPQAQEILQILPHPVWGDYGYPVKTGEGWIGDPRSWELDDPGTEPARRRWTSVDLGTEIYKDPNQVAEWTVSDFDILVPEQ
ncbi:hypothetical protein RHGRI_037734 [Rhododendron griersonianum]|uniref:DUF7705 domain-containing protein n=1 Tax=Rhododendron griersonianum TaxID=479676 RepID=A0AAV6HSV4_9ERIC|nr:hypothetical protein RHGRI_037734 [Rhododendron griersonianum]